MTLQKRKTSSPRIGGWRIGIIGIVVSALAVYFVVSQLDMALLGQALAGARYIYVLPCAALLLLGLLTRALRWRGLLDNALPIPRAFHILNVSYLVNGILPLRLGEVGRAYLAARANPAVTLPRALSTIVVERLLDLLAVLALVALGASAALPPELRAAALALAPLAFVGLLVLVALAANRGFALRLIDGITTRIPALGRLPIVRLAGDVLDGFAPLAQPRAFAQAVGWTVISWALSVAAGYVLMLAFYEAADWAATCLFIAAASLAIAVPAVPGSIGTYEASILLALGAFPAYANAPEQATAFAVVVHGVNLLLYAATGAIGLLREGVSLGELRGSKTLKSS
jgi:glycosyltransferase 2 family protein